MKYHDLSDTPVSPALLPSLGLRWLFAGCSLCVVAAGFVLAMTLSAVATDVLPSYDPLAVSGGSDEVLERVVYDASRKREIPILIYLPATRAPSPVVIFSHGLGGTRHGCSYLGRHWAARGYVGVFLQHPGSDDSVWKGEEGMQGRYTAMKKAANAKNLILRAGDVKALLDQLEGDLGQGPQLKGRLDLTRVAMSGHSFGATTTQAVSGQVLPLIGSRHVDGRIDAALVMSPNTPKKGEVTRAFGSVKVPWMLMTGTQDLSPIGLADVDTRLGVYPALPKSIAKYELVLDGGQHHAFTDHERPGLDARDPNDHRVILALSTAFLDTYLRKDPAAAAWLHSGGPRSVMAQEDRWQLNLP